MTESPEGRMALAIMILNEKKKLLANYNSSMSIAYYSAAILTVPAALIAVSLSSTGSRWALLSFVLFSVLFAAHAMWQGGKSLKAALASLDDMKLPPTDSSR